MGTPATPDRDFVRNLVNIISHGANLGYQGPRKFSIAANLTSAFEHPEAIDTQISKECGKGHLSDPLGSSVNCGIDPESYSLVYSPLQNARFFRRLINLSTKARRLHHYYTSMQHPAWTSFGGETSFHSGMAVLQYWTRYGLQPIRCSCTQTPR